MYECDPSAAENSVRIEEYNRKERKTAKKKKNHEWAFNGVHTSLFLTVYPSQG